MPGFPQSQLLIVVWGQSFRLTSSELRRVRNVGCKWLRKKPFPGRCWAGWRVPICFILGVPIHSCTLGWSRNAKNVSCFRFGCTWLMKFIGFYCTVLFSSYCPSTLCRSDHSVRPPRPEPASYNILKLPIGCWAAVTAIIQNYIVSISKYLSTSGIVAKYVSSLRRREVQQNFSIPKWYPNGFTGG